MDNPLPLKKTRHVQSMSPVAGRTFLQAEEMVREDGEKKYLKR